MHEDEKGRAPAHLANRDRRLEQAPPLLALAVWLGFVVGALALLATTGTKELLDGNVGESAKGYAWMREHSGNGAAPEEFGYLHSSSLRTTDPAFSAALRDVAKRMRSVVQHPVTVQRSSDGHSAIVIAQVGELSQARDLNSSVLAARSAHPGIDIEESGPVSSSMLTPDTGKRDLHRAELLSAPVTLGVLLIAFGALVAALVPVLLAVTAVAAAFGLLGAISQVFPLDSGVKTVLVLIGMAVGVDYALFYVVRAREERRRGLSSDDALARTAGTSGRTVLIAGATVATAMAGQFAVGLPIFNAISSATIAVVACAVIGSITVLPAVLELLGARIDRGRIPFIGRRRDSADGRFWPAVIDRVLRRPLVAAVAAAGLLAALAVPAFGMHVADPSDQSLKPPTPAQQELARIRAEFPSASQTALLIVTVPPGRRAAVKRALTKLGNQAAAQGIAHPPYTFGTSEDGQLDVLALPLTGAGSNDASRAAVKKLRTDLIPATVGTVPGTHAAVTGDTAADVDFTDQMKAGLPYVIAFVLVLAFVLLLLAFRSIIVPLKAIVLNLLSVGAAYGVLVLVFQHHWAEGILGFHSNGAIIAWLPLFLFVVLFGLSMDYHVFILSRVREAVDDGMTTDDALRYGITRTAGVVTSAALVMVGVFSLFATLSALDLKQAGVGLATAVLIDATLVRGVLLPASMKLLGERNWYLPRRLEWLPRAHAEPLPESLPVS